MPDTPTDKSKITNPDDRGLAEAATALGRGELVCMPTETVYGLAADATNDQAVANIYAAKGRPDFNPLIVHVADLDAAGDIAVLDEAARQLAAIFWPGPFTLVLKRREDSTVSLLVSAGLDTIAVRVPGHPVARALIRQYGKPLAAPSANLSGRISPTRAEHIESALIDKVSLVLDGGACANGLESTIVRLHNGNVELLRPGSVTPEDITQTTGLNVVPAPATENPGAPGQLKSHYAPRAELRLGASTPKPGEAFLAFGLAPDAPFSMNLSKAANLTEAAGNLFAMLRELDQTGARIIAVMPIPEHGLGLAINDRLRRAAAPRPPQITTSRESN